MNLFLFFVISFGLTSSLASKHQESPLKVNLPTLEKGPTVQSPMQHEILLTKSGEILWDGITTQLEKLKENLTRRENKTGQIALRADRDASVQSLVSILEVIRTTGATNISLQTEITQQKS